MDDQAKAFLRDLFSEEHPAARLRGVQRCLVILQEEARRLEEPLLDNFLGSCALLAGERATNHEDGFIDTGLRFHGIARGGH
jgi:hypothetical protein